MPVEVFDEIMNVNFRTVMLVTKAALPYMVKQQCGNIVNIASAAALRGLPGSSAYSASKAAVVCLSQTLGDELRPHHIRVNVVCPDRSIRSFSRNPPSGTSFLRPVATCFRRKP
jgi:NAD(P)-dependent dehydrogenase (short-subunit alcohol dehydrogenase family)